MFKFNQGRDRFVPDRQRSPYSFYPLHHTPVNHQYDCVSHCGKEFDFLEPFECERQQEQQHRSFRQLQSYLSLESTDGHLLRHILKKRNDCSNCSDKADLITMYRDVNLTWPIRMVHQRRLARKSNRSTNKSLVADLLLDMPNLSNDWLSKILDWSLTGYLTAAIQSSIHLWSCHTQSVQYTINAVDADRLHHGGATKTTISCLKWDAQGQKLGYSFTVERDDGPSADDSLLSFDTSDDDWDDAVGSGDPSSYTVVERMNASAARIRRSAEQDDTSAERIRRSVEEDDAMNDTYRSPVSFDLSAETLRRRRNNKKNVAKTTGHIKVWILNDNSNTEQKTSKCGCIFDDTICPLLNECSINVMDWLANGRILVTGCTRATVTFFRYDSEEKKLLTTRIIHRPECKTLISCLHVSQDRWSRHLAVATYSIRACVLKVWRIEDSREPCQMRLSDSSINVTETLTDRYNSKQRSRLNWAIKAFAWHPWKHALMCYTVTSIPENTLQVYAKRPFASWLVLANACTGQVLKRVDQTSISCCPTVNILHVNTHSMTFSRLTGELLLSATTMYKLRDNADSSPTLMEKHSIVVMHALDRIVETLSSSNTDRGLFFAWSPDGKRIALTSSDESLRIWNFWPTSGVKPKVDCQPSVVTTTMATPAVTPVNPVEYGGANYSNHRFIHNLSSINSQSAMSELSLDAARIIK